MTREQGFSKKERLVKTGEFRKVYKEGKVVRRDGAALFFMKNSGQINRLGIAVSARFVKKATRRNRIKRLIREIYRKKKAVLRSGHDIVVSVKNDFGGRQINYQIIENLLTALLKKSGLLA